jgi:hypothetical protein
VNFFILLSVLVVDGGDLFNAGRFCLPAMRSPYGYNSFHDAYLVPSLRSRFQHFSFSRFQLLPHRPAPSAFSAGAIIDLRSPTSGLRPLNFAFHLSTFDFEKVFSFLTLRPNRRRRCPVCDLVRRKTDRSYWDVCDRVRGKYSRCPRDLSERGRIVGTTAMALAPW